MLKINKKTFSTLWMALILVVVLALSATLVACGDQAETDSDFIPHDENQIESELEGEYEDEHGSESGSESEPGTDSELESESGPKLGSQVEAGSEANAGLNADSDANPKPDGGGDGTKAPADKSGTLSCTFSINCSTIFDNLDKIDASVLGLQPKDGWIFSPTKIEFAEGESVFDILLRLTRQEKIHMEFNSNPALSSKYVEGINNLYEFDVGELSGWTYKINGKGMGYGSSGSYPKDGDVIEWVYTCDQGRDVGYEP